MLHVLIDTNVYLQHRNLETNDLNALRELGSARLIQLHVPEIVRREFVTHVVHDVRSSIHNALKELKTVKRSPLHYESRVSLDNAVATLSSIRDTYEAQADQLFSQFVSLTNASELLVPGSQAREVFNAYFSGGPPFAVQKSRQDIPDAFIFQSVQGLARQYHPLYVVVKDKKFAKHCAALPNVVVFGSLDDLTGADVFQSLLRQRENFVSVVDAITELIPQLIEERNIGIRRSVEIFAPGQAVVPALGHTGHTTVWEVTDIKGISYVDDSVRYLGEGRFRVHIDVAFLAEVEYQLFQSSREQCNCNEDVNYTEIGRTPEGVITARKEFELSSRTLYYVNFDYEFIRNVEASALGLDELRAKVGKPGMGPLEVELVGPAT